MRTIVTVVSLIANHRICLKQSLTVENLYCQYGQLVRDTKSLGMCGQGHEHLNQASLTTGPEYKSNISGDGPVESD